MKKIGYIFGIFLILTLFFPIKFIQCQNGTEVIGILQENTIWTVENSPYHLIGPTAIETGYTLEIEPGVIVNLNSYFIRINGTLIARGTNIDNIFFNEGEIVFTDVSANWSELTSIGCIMEESFLNSTTLAIQNTSPMIRKNTFIDGGISSGGLANISNNYFERDGISSGGMARITNNNFIDCGIEIGGFGIYAFADSGTALVSNNIVTRGHISVSGGTLTGYPQVFNNTIRGGSGIISGGYAHIYNNSILDCEFGIHLRGYAVFGGSVPCYQLVENNLVVGNTHGIRIDLYSRLDIGTLFPTIRNNTLYRNTIGIFVTENLYESAPELMNNNIVDNLDYACYLDGVPFDINATTNYWGTTNTSIIDSLIFDFNEDFRLGKVNYIPLLNEINNKAPFITQFSPSPPSSDIIRTLVTGVIDGDTFLTNEGYKIRLADIDAPEFGESGYLESTEYLESLIKNKSVTLDIDSVTGTDPYGRYVCLAYVDFNSTHYLNVNKLLVEVNHAVIDNYTNNEFEPNNWTLYTQIAIIPEFQSKLIILFILISCIITLFAKNKIKQKKF